MGGFWPRRGGGRLPWWVVSLSLYATLFSSITFLSIPALTYHSDCRYFFKTIGILVLVPVVVRYYLPFFRRLNLTSAYEYLEVRFNLGCRLFASAAFILFMVARTAVVAYLPAVALAAVTGMDVNLAIVAVTFVTIVYCTVGGVEAVVWSDFVQSVILIGSTVAIYAYLVCGTDGGLSGFLSKGMAAGKFRMLDFGWDWSQPVLWVAAATMSTLSANLNSAATAFTTDFYRRLRKAGLEDAGARERRTLLVGKVSTVVIGLLGGAFALVLANMDIGSVYDQFLKFLGVLTGGLACLFLMGRFLPFVNGRGAFVGLVANYAVCLALDLVPLARKPHVLLYGFFGMVACLVVAPLASRLCGDRTPALSER